MTQRFSRARWLIGLLVVATLIAGACAPAAPTPAPAKPAATTAPAAAPAATTAPAKPAAEAKFALETPNVQIWGSRDPQSMGEVEIAAQKGYFKDEGLNVEVKYVAFGSEIPSGVAGGSVKVAKVASSGLIQIAQTMPIKMLVRTSELAGGLGLVVRTDRNIKTLKDLEGKKVGGPRTGVVLEGIQKLFKAYGIDFGKITFVNMLPPDAVIAFQKGDIDAFWGPEPALSATQEAGGKLLHTGLISYLEATPQPKDIGWFIPDMLFATKDYYDKNPNTLLAIMRASKKGIDFINTQPKDAAQMLAPAMNFKPSIMENSLKEFKFYFDFDDSNLGEPMDRLAQYLVDVGEHKSAPKFKDYADPTLLRKLYPEAVKTKMFP